MADFPSTLRNTRTLYIDDKMNRKTLESFKQGEVEDGFSINLLGVTYKYVGPIAGQAGYSPGTFTTAADWEQVSAAKSDVDALTARVDGIQIGGVTYKIVDIARIDALSMDNFYYSDLTSSAPVDLTFLLDGRAEGAKRIIILTLTQAVEVSLHGAQMEEFTSGMVLMAGTWKIEIEVQGSLLSGRILPTTFSASGSVSTEVADQQFLLAVTRAKRGDPEGTRIGTLAAYDSAGRVLSESSFTITNDANGLFKLSATASNVVEIGPTPSPTGATSQTASFTVEARAKNGTNVYTETHQYVFPASS